MINVNIASYIVIFQEIPSFLIHHRSNNDNACNKPTHVCP